VCNKVAICILNYNGSKDTIDCIRSIKKYECCLEFQILIYDNNSISDDLETLRDALACEFFSFFEINPDSIDDDELVRASDSSCILFSGTENLGFAKANNWLMRFALNEGFDHVVLLNNDTELVDDSISKLLKAYSDPTVQCDYATTDIRFYSDPEKSWNAGGSIFFGTRRYYRETDVLRFQKRGELFPRVEFITGCFLLLDRRAIKKLGFLSEDFFFGEEDYEFALRAKEKGAVGRVLLSTHILHKVGATASRSSANRILSRDYVHRLNRVIDMKHYYRPLRWKLWLAITSVYYFVDSIKRLGLGRKEATAYVGNIVRLGSVLNRVSKDTFERLITMDRQALVTCFDDETLDLFANLPSCPVVDK